MRSHVQSCKLALSEEALLCFGGTGPERRLVHERQTWAPLKLALHLLLLMTLLPPPTPSPSSSQQLFSPVHSTSAPRCQLFYPTVVLLFKVLHCKILNAFFIFCVCFSCIICVESFIHLLQYSTIEPTALVGYLSELCRAQQTNWTYKRALGAEPLIWRWLATLVDDGRVETRGLSFLPHHPCLQNPDIYSLARNLSQTSEQTCKPLATYLMRDILKSLGLMM